MTHLLLTIALAATPVPGQAAMPRPASAQEAAKLYNEGNAQYAAGDYAGAIGSYLSSLAGADNPAVRYNLGNAYFKDGQLGRAVNQYLGARSRSPRDRDIASNLEYVRNYRVDKVLSRPGPLEEALDGAVHFFSVTEAGTLASLSFLLAAALASLGIARRRRWPLYASALPLAAFIYFIIVTQAWSAERRSNPGTIVAKEVSALSGPGEDFKEILLLHDGTEVAIREIRGEYLLVQLPGGAGGWVPRRAVERVY